MRDYVTDRLCEAAITLLCVRNWRQVPLELANRWERIALGLLEYADLWDAAMAWPRPSGARVARMVEVLRWLEPLRNDDQRLAICRLARAPGSDRPIVGQLTLAKSLGVTQGRVAIRFDELVVAIAQRLEAAELVA